MPDRKFKHRGLRFHEFSWVVRGKTFWRVYCSAHENMGKKPTNDDPGRFGNTRAGEAGTKEEMAEIAVERLNRLLVEDGELPLEFTEGKSIESTKKQEYEL